MHQLCFIYCSIFMLCVFIFENRFWFNKRFVLQHYAEKWKKKRPFSLLRQSQVLYIRFRFTTIMPVVHLWKWKLIFFLSIAVSSLRSEEDKNKKQNNPSTVFLFLSLSPFVWSTSFNPITMYAFKMNRSITFHLLNWL